MHWIEGIVPVEAAVLAGRRDVARVLIDENRRDGRTARLQKALGKAGIEFHRVPPAEIVRQAAGEHHGGILAEVGARRFQAIEDLLPAEDKAALFMLDGVEDPYNFGQAIRSLYAAGATGLLVRSRNWFSADNVVLRSSAGASEFLPAAVVESPEEVAQYAREAGLLVACAALDEALPVFEADLTQPLLMVVGGEKRGITRSFLRAADIRLAIPYGRATAGYELGTTAAATIIAYEMSRQRLIAASHTRP